MSVENSIVLLTSADPENTKFGTGFVIHVDDDGACLLTCRHVVVDVGAGESKSVRVDNQEYSVTGLSMNPGDDPDDMAVLKIDVLKDRRPLRMAPASASGVSTRIVGHYLFEKRAVKHRKLPVDGVLGELGFFPFKSRKGSVGAWDLEIQGHRHLKEGYSGSPVMNAETDTVVGVVSHMLPKGEMGVAICVSLLSEIWEDMPPGLLEPPAQQPSPEKDPVKAEPTIKADSDLSRNAETAPSPESSRKTKPERKQFAPVDPKMCNRSDEDTLFENFFMDHCRECPPSPLFFIIPGEEDEYHDSLVERFKDTWVKPFIKTLVKEGNLSDDSSISHYARPKWRINGDMSKANRQDTVRRQFYRAFYKKDFPNQDLKLVDMFREIEATKYKAVVFSYTIYARRWDPEPVSWFITEFWKKGFVCKENDKMPLFLIFFKILYPESDRQKWYQKIYWNRFRKRSIAKQLSRLTAECVERGCRVLLFDELEKVGYPPKAGQIRNIKMLAMGSRK